MYDGEASAKRMCDGETSAKRICDGKASAKAYAKEKHRLKDGKITWQRWRNINLTRFKTNPRGAQINKIGLYFLPSRRI